MQAILDWITVNASYAGLIIFFISCLESLALVGILVPGMALMLGIGTLVGIGVLPFWPTVLWATLGAIVGDGLSFWLGRHYNQRLHHIWPLSRHPTLIPKGEQFFHKHGELSILFGRFVGPLRAIVPAVAGMMEMSPARFYLMNILSAIAWAPMVVIPGAVFGASTQVAADVGLRLLLLVVALILVLWFLVWLFHRVLGFSLELVQRQFQIPTRKVVILAYILLITMLISAPVIILTEKSAEIPSSFKHTQWWSTQWQSLANTNPQFNIQYFGDLSVIRQLSLQTGWYHPDSLTANNVLQWLAPNNELANLPLYVAGLNDTEAKVWVVAFAVDDDRKKIDLDESSSLYLLSIKKYTNIKNQESTCFGFGRLQKLVYEPLFFGIGIPKVSQIDNIPDTVIADLKAIDGLEFIVREHKNSQLLTIRSMETFECSLKNFSSE